MQSSKLKKTLFYIFLFFSAKNAFARDSWRAFVERTGAAFNRIELMACDLTDELIYGWKKNLPVPLGSSIYLAGVYAPYGLNSVFTAFIENHFFDLIGSQLSRELKWIHCPSCSHLVAYSTKERTVFASSYDIEEDHLANSRFDYGLYLDFSTENEKLILRARLFDAKDKNIIFSKTLVTSSKTPPLLRPAHALVSQEEARREYIDLLKEKPLSQASFNLTTKIFASLDDGAALSASMPPMIWFEVAQDYYLNSSKKNFAGFSLGLTSLPKAYDGFSFAVRGGFLVFRPFYSLVDPNMYFYFEGASQFLQGSGAMLFMNKKRLRIDQIANEMSGEQKTHKVILPFIRLGFETKIKNIFRSGFFIEGFPTELDNQNFAKVFSYFHSYGFECGVML